MAALLIALVSLVAPASTASQSPPTASVLPTHEEDTAVVARIDVASQAEINNLAGRYDLWSVDLAAGHVMALLRPGQMSELQAAGYSVTVNAEMTAQLSRWRLAPAAATGGIPGFTCYRTTAEIDADLAGLAAAHPLLAQWTVIGQSWRKANQLGGTDLHALVITNRALATPKPKLAVMAAIHARELTTAETAVRFAERLVAKYGQDADVTWLLDHTEVHILPMVNPDGRRIVEERLALWRKNTNDSDGCWDDPYFGVDLNRNSSFKWNACEGAYCSSGNACAETYRGRGPASEPETQAVEEYLRGIFPDQRGDDDEDAAPADATGIFVTLHSYGGLVLYPWGWRSTPAPNGTELDRLGRKLAYFNGYEVCQAGADGCLYQTDGATDDWVYGELGVAAFNFEMGDYFFQGCSSFEDSILQANLDALLYAAKAARQPYHMPAGPDAVDLTAALASALPGAPVTVTATIDSTRFVSPTLSASGMISSARLTVDGSLPITAAAVYTLTAVDGVFDSPVEQVVGVVDTRRWQPGRYLIVVDGQSDTGVWGAPAVAFLQIEDTASHRVYLPLLARDRRP